MSADYAHHAVKTPRRIQRKRAKGWTMPEDAVYVGRPTKWGNPYKWNDYPASRSETSIDGESYTMRFSDEQRRNWAVSDYKHQYLTRHADSPTREEIRADLAGKNLACWCPLDQPCHADILLEIANTTGVSA